MKLKTLSQRMIDRFREHAYVHVPNGLSSTETVCLQKWVEEVANWPETPHKWMQYFEKAYDSDRQLCRTEHFIEFHEGLRSLVSGSDTLDVIAQLMGEPATLFKEKINFKFPGGAGFAPHQDAPAFSYFGPEYHITMMISVDASTPENGGLEFSNRQDCGDVLPQAPDGCIVKSLASSMEWTPLTTQPGDIVFFDS